MTKYTIKRKELYDREFSSADKKYIGGSDCPTTNTLELVHILKAIIEEIT